MRLKLTSNLRPIVNYDVLPVAGDDAPVLLNNRELHILRQLTYPYLVSGYAAYHPEGYVWYAELTDAERISFGEESEVLINKLGGGDPVTYLTTAMHTAIGTDAPHHAAATLDADAAELLDVSAAQVLGFDVQAINTVLAGPSSGEANEPTFRALVAADLPFAYSEGTWTPVFVSIGATFAYTAQTGSYTIIGNRVFFSLFLRLSSAPGGTTTNLVYIALPAVGTPTAGSAAAIGLHSNITLDTGTQLNATVTSARIELFCAGSGLTYDGVEAADLAADTRIYISGQYPI